MEGEGRGKAQRVALVSLVAAVGLVTAKLLAGLASGSLALISEAAHSALDAAATALTFYAVRVASRPPDEEHPYGHGKAENISALIETTALLGLSLYIVTAAVGRLRGGGHEIDTSWYTFAVMGLSIVVDASRARVLRRAGRTYRSPALEADALHFTADMMTSAVVIVGLILVALGYPDADAAGSVLIAGYVAFSSIRLGRKAIDALMDRAPEGALEQLEEAAAGVSGVEEVRRVRMRHAGGQAQADVVIAISRTVPLETAHQVTEHVEEAIKEIQPGADVVVHVEPLANEVLVAQRVRSLAALEPRVSEVHNVVVTAQADGLHISLHCKFPGATTLGEAHAIAEHLETEIANGISGVARIDTHLEPLEVGIPKGADVTALSAALVGSAREVAQRQKEVENCHEVLVTRSGEKLSLVIHCDAAPGLTVQEVHDASTRIEDEIHRRWHDVERVTVHFEPSGSAARLE